MNRHSDQTTTSIPFWRDERVLKILAQIVFLLFIIGIITLLYRNMLQGLASLGLKLNLNFVHMEAGFGISEGIPYSPGDTYLRAFTVGVANTLRVSIVGLLLTTVLGIVIGISRLSSNWLIRTIAGGFIEIFRNTPLLLQLLFWYTAVLLKLPPVRQSVELFDSLFISQRGVYLPRPVPTASFPVWQYFLFAAIVAAIVVYWVRARSLKRQGRPGFPGFWAFGALVAIPLVGWFLAPGSPVNLEIPALKFFNFAGGIHLSPEFTALLLGLVVYTGAFIAEIVRAGIQSVDRGQREAATSLGLKPFHVTYLIILPQALRVIIPPLTSQYLNLAKNSSLAIAIGFPDLFNIGTTTLNQTGQSIPVFAMIMGSYLALSLVTSLFMNWYNRRVRLVER